MAREHLGGAVVVPGDHLPERLRVEPLTERSGPHEVAEDHRDRFADLPARAGGGKGGPAGKTEPGPRRIVLAAVRADRHAESVGGKPGHGYLRLQTAHPPRSCYQTSGRPHRDSSSASKASPMSVPSSCPTPLPEGHSSGQRSGSRPPRLQALESLTG